MEELSVKSFDGFPLSATLFPLESPVGLVVIHYGLKEQKERYYWFCLWLNSIGYAALVFDPRGHGGSANKVCPLGHMEDSSVLVSDLLSVTNFMKLKYPNKPLALFSHSYGTVIARRYLEKHDNEVSKVLMSGTLAYHSGLKTLIALGVNVIKKEGEQGLSLSSFYDQGKTSWICSNPKTIDDLKASAYWNKFRYDDVSWKHIAEGILDTHAIGNYLFQNPDLEIYLLNGGDDPMTGFAAGRSDSLNTLKKIGYRKVFSRTFRGMRHEVINEKDSYKVLAEIRKDLLKGTKER